MESDIDDSSLDYALAEEAASDEYSDNDSMFDMFTGQAYEPTRHQSLDDTYESVSGAATCSEDRHTNRVKGFEVTHPEPETTITQSGLSTSSSNIESTLECNRSVNTLNLKNQPSREYQWKRLDDNSSTRLLEILPAEYPDSVVQGHMKISGRVNYRAISYVWGPTFEDDSHLTHSILCDGKSIAVSSNLYQILKTVRNHLDSGHWIEFNSRPCIWVDAICINQRDIKERNHQVEMMASIYRHAQGLIIYLGEPEKDEDLALERTAHVIFAHREGTAVNGKSLEHLDFQKSDMIALLRRPWFDRRWIIQEFAMQKRRTVLFGRVAIQFEAFYATIVHFELLHEAGVMRDVERFDGFRPYRWLLANLYRYRESKCQRPHDVVFALMSFSCGCSRSSCSSRCGEYRCGLRNYSVDYNQPIKGLMVQLAEKLGATDSTAILTLACCIRANEAGHPYRSSLPSWVPDWTLNTDTISGTQSDFLEKRFTILGNTGQGLSFTWPSETLFLRSGALDLTVISNGKDTIKLVGWIVERPPSSTAVKKIDWDLRTPRVGTKRLEGQVTWRANPEIRRIFGQIYHAKYFPRGAATQVIHEDWPLIDPSALILFTPIRRVVFVLHQTEDLTYRLVNFLPRTQVATDLHVAFASRSSGQLFGYCNLVKDPIELSVV